MSINLDDAFEVQPEGIAITDNAGEALLYIASGDGDPSGTPAPLNTWFFRRDTRELYIKIGLLDTEWSLYSPETEFPYIEYSSGSLPLEPNDNYALDGGDLDCIYTASVRIDGGNL